MKVNTIYMKVNTIYSQFILKLYYLIVNQISGFVIKSSLSLSRVLSLGLSYSHGTRYLIFITILQNLLVGKISSTMRFDYFLAVPTSLTRGCASQSHSRSKQRAFRNSQDLRPPSTSRHVHRCAPSEDVRLPHRLPS